MLILKDLLLRYQKLTSDHLIEIVSDYYLYDEKDFVEQLKAISHLEPSAEQAIQQLSATLISVASESHKLPLLNQVLSEYKLNGTEGVQLLSLAEGLLRIKDQDTAQRFIEDKVIAGDWESHKQKSKHSAVNLATEGLSKLKSWLVSNEEEKPFHHWLNASRNVLAREALKLLVSRLATIFIRGASIQSALSKGTSNTTHCCSYDMLGEAALTEEDADRYLENYLAAIDAVALHEKNAPKAPPSSPKDSVSIKLSALTPKFEFRHQSPLQRRFLVRVEKLVRSAHEQNVEITMDAEESDQLELTLSVFKHCLTLPGLKGWGRLGIAIQAYGFRAIPTILFIAQLAKEHQTRVPVRLVKGAYWDNEINKAQQLGLAGYPVFIQKQATDLNYQVCIQLLLEQQLAGHVRPQFATHNATSIATVITLARLLDDKQETLFPIEFQRLHGMGETIYNALSGYQKHFTEYVCRTYCPVGPYKELLPYLIRRILENGANQSFLNELASFKDNAETLSQLPIHGLVQYDRYHQDFPLPIDIYQPFFTETVGCNINQPGHWQRLSEACNPFTDTIYQVHSAIPDDLKQEEIAETLFSPNDKTHRLGISYTLTKVDQPAFRTLLSGRASWSAYPPDKRIDIIKVFASKLESNQYEFITLCIREAGKTWQDAIAEMKEAIGFCRYYANQYNGMKSTTVLPGTVNEKNQFKYNPKGNFICISPWNFPIAILVGQVVAALITGNRVIIKPAPQTRICARRIFDLLRESNVPADSLYYLTSDNQLTQTLLSTPNIDGVAFTGSLSTARKIQQHLLENHPYPIPVISETSGINCMITDDSILTEQMVKDVVHSAFGSAGQRCSALRVVFIHDSVFEETVKALIGAMNVLQVGNSLTPSTDLGPIIDQDALTSLVSYIAQKDQLNQILHAIPPSMKTGHYLSPILVELKSLTELTRETFGPILHVVRYKTNEVEQIISDIETSDYALTIGIHSRDKNWVDYLCSQLSMGNIYINRHITGAQVGAQPFGGNKRSGTGFKAGGPNYLLQFVNEQCISENLAAIGGNTKLITKSH
ncbi:bifunctional proline dehydrogenase/L-glutamate gamma-semialdehyde dehydrogenase PutA [Litoribacillus peritrichatus]|uniref:Bifunctional protein PutA n=1 Tax=Litoribacillus peritrichatus TaxID=718191 RepID=A0ABP7M3I1_9GAMM